MNLLFRLLWTLFFSRGRKAVSSLGPCATPFRVWPTDLDVLMHVNNGKYFSMMDVARVDLMRRSGALSKFNALGWYPVVVAETATFLRSLTPGDRFEIHSEVIGWDSKHFFMRQWFVRGDTTVAEAHVKARFLKRRGGSVSTVELLQVLEVDSSSPTLPSWVSVWSARQDDVAASLSIKKSQ